MAQPLDDSTSNGKIRQLEAEGTIHKLSSGPQVGKDASRKRRACLPQRAVAFLFGYVANLVHLIVTNYF